MVRLCDEMLRGLARRLRAAGHDTVVAASGTADRDVLARAARDGRILLTRDRHLAAIGREVAPICLIAGQTVDAQAREARARLGLDWLAAPFTRCMVDNAVLLAAAAHHATRVPAQSGGDAVALRICPGCGRLYWPGGHVRRMRARLASWQGK
jgi:uncharacterized protein